MSPSYTATKSVVAWGLALVAVFMVGALIDASGVSGTCMFILIAAFAAFVATYPILIVNRFGTGILVYVPYAMFGFFPLYYFDWLQSGALIGLWAVFLWAATGPMIGLCLDLTMIATSKLKLSLRAVLVGSVMQGVTFCVMLLGLTYLYLPTATGVGHLHFFNREWFFTLPWMVVNGAFGGYTAYAFASRSAVKDMG